MVSDEALIAYYETKNRAEERRVASGERRDMSTDVLRDDIESRGQELYRERLGNLATLDVGEVGVGAGDFARYAFEHKPRSLALIDVSRARMDLLAQEFGRRSGEVEIKLVLANAQSMDGVATASLDLLVAKEVIEHLKDYRPFLAESARVLRPGGRLYLTTPNRNAIDLLPRNALSRIAAPKKHRGEQLMHDLFGDLYGYLTQEEREELIAVLPDGFREHIHEFAPGELLRALRRHGFACVRRWGTPPHMFYHELRALSRRLLPLWNRAERLSYALGDNLRVIARRAESPRRAG